jgi:hypothetical protein
MLLQLLLLLIHVSAAASSACVAAAAAPCAAQIWYLPDGMRCFQDPTEVEWIEDKLWSQRLDEGWDLAQVGVGG